MTGRLSGKQNVFQQEQQAARRGNFLSRVIGRQMLFEKLLKPHPIEQSIHQRQAADRPRAKRLVSRSGPMPAIVFVGNGFGLLFFLFVTHAVIFTASRTFWKCPVGP
jgi:hypothetical protein